VAKYIDLGPANRSNRVHHVTQPEKAQVKVLHLPVVLWDAGDLYSQLVVHKQDRGCIEQVAKLAKERAHPDHLLARREGRDELSLCCREPNNVLGMGIQETVPVPIFTM
jgi:hypothetical protein